MVCEICGSSEFIKRDGLFVCDGCGMKYTLEEIKKLSLGDNAVKETAESNEENQINETENTEDFEKLLKEARGLFESKQYVECEKLCSKVLGNDPKSIEAWALKAQSIFYDHWAKPVRALDYMCAAISAYDLYDDEQKKESAQRILESIKECYKKEIFNATNSFAAPFLTADRAEWLIKTFTSGYNALLNTYKKLGSQEEAQAYLSELKNQFIQVCVIRCEDVWKNSVAFQYYKTRQFAFQVNFKHTDFIPLYANHYFPKAEDWSVFSFRGNLLIEILQFAETQFDDETHEKTKADLSRLVIFIQENILESVFFEQQGGAWVKRPGLYGLERSKAQQRVIDYNILFERAKQNMQKQEYLLKRKAAFNESSANEAKVDEYWAEHAEEREKLQAQIEEKLQRIDLLTQQKEKVNRTKELGEIYDNIKATAAKLENAKLYEPSKKVKLMEEIELLNQKVDEIQKSTETQKAALQSEIDSLKQEIATIRNYFKNPFNTNESR